MHLVSLKLPTLLLPEPEARKTYSGSPQIQTPLEIVLTREVSLLYVKTCIQGKKMSLFWGVDFHCTVNYSA